MGLHVTQKAASRQDALSAKAAEHMNLASIVAQNLGQLVDRAQAVGRVTQHDMKSLRQGNLSLARILVEDPAFKRMSLYDRQGRLLASSHADEPQALPRIGSTSSRRGFPTMASNPSCPTSRLQTPQRPGSTGACRSFCR